MSETEIISATERVLKLFQNYPWDIEHVRKNIHELQ